MSENDDRIPTEIIQTFKYDDGTVVEATYVLAKRQKRRPSPDAVVTIRGEFQEGVADHLNMAIPVDQKEANVLFYSPLGDLLRQAWMTFATQYANEPVGNSEFSKMWSDKGHAKYISQEARYGEYSRLAMCNLLSDALEISKTNNLTGIDSVKSLKRVAMPLARDGAYIADAYRALRKEKANGHSA